MNVKQLHDTLIHRIHRFGAAAREYRQVYRRLEQLIPDRLGGIVSQLRRKGMGSSEATRNAYVSDEFITHVNELVEVAATSFESRIQYETHMMLFEARRTLRAFHQHR